MFSLFKKAMVKQTIDDDPDESIKDLVELSLKKMVRLLQPFPFPSICLPNCILASLYIGLPVFLPVILSVCLPACFVIYLTICPSALTDLVKICLDVCLYVFICLSVSVSLCRSVCLCLSACLCPYVCACLSLGVCLSLSVCLSRFACLLHVCAQKIVSTRLPSITVSI